MSRQKRVRKARMKARQARRFDKMIARGAMLVELEERARFRRELEASDLPDAMKTVLGFFADPIGYAADMAAKIAAQRDNEEPEPRDSALALENAPVDDEPYTAEERAAVEEARAGKVVPSEELRKILGL